MANIALITSEENLQNMAVGLTELNKFTVLFMFENVLRLRHDI